MSRYYIIHAERSQDVFRNYKLAECMQNTLLTFVRHLLNSWGISLSLWHDVCRILNVPCSKVIWHRDNCETSELMKLCILLEDFIFTQYFVIKTLLNVPYSSVTWHRDNCETAEGDESIYLSWGESGDGIRCSIIGLCRHL